MGGRWGGWALEKNWQYKEKAIPWLHFSYAPGTQVPPCQPLCSTTGLGPTICHLEEAGSNPVHLSEAGSVTDRVRAWLESDKWKGGDSDLTGISVAPTLWCRPMESLSRKPKESFGFSESQWGVPPGIPLKVLAPFWAMTCWRSCLWKEWMLISVRISLHIRATKKMFLSFGMLLSYLVSSLPSLLTFTKSIV